MAAITICSDFGAPKNKVWHCFHCSPIYFPWNDGTGCHDLYFYVKDGVCHTEVQTRWLLRSALFAFGKWGYLVFTSWLPKKKREEENRVPDALFLVCQRSFVQINPYWMKANPVDLSALKGEGYARVWRNRAQKELWKLAAPSWI